MGKPKATFFLFSLFLLFASWASATQIIDQEYTPYPLYGFDSVDFYKNSGQSFTPTLSSIDFFTFQFVNFGGPSATYVIDLHQGQGPDGALVATSNPTKIPAQLTGDTTFGFPSQNFEFDFATHVALTPGQVYTAVVRNLHPGAANFGIGGALDPYAGGMALHGDSPEGTFASFYFIEGVVKVPEPSSVLLALVGAALAAPLALRRR